MGFKVVRPRLEDKNERRIARVFTITPKTKRQIELTARRLRRKPKLTASSLVEALCKSGGLKKAQDYVEQMAKENGGKLPPPKERHGEEKERKSYTLSNYAASAIDGWSKTLWISKAEVLECAVRGGGLEDAIAYLQKK